MNEHAQYDERDAGDGGIVLRPVGEEPPLVETDGVLVSTASLDEDATSFDLVERIRDLRRDRPEFPA